MCEKEIQVFHTWPHILTFWTLNKDQAAKGGLRFEGILTFKMANKRCQVTPLSR